MKRLLALAVLLAVSSSSYAGFLDTDPDQFPTPDDAKVHATCYSGGTVIFDEDVVKATTLNNYSSQSPNIAYLTKDGTWEVFSNGACRTSIRFKK